MTDISNLILPPNHMYNLANSFTKIFGYDDTLENTYRFNSMGYRSHHEFSTNNNPIIIIGNSISFGIGVPYEKTFGYIIETLTKRPVYNFSVGCFLHSNNWQLKRCREIIKSFNPSFVIFQINNINRISIGEKTIISKNKNIILTTFYDFYEELKNLFNGINHLLIYWDNMSFSLPQYIINDLCIYNKYHVDKSCNLDYVFGIKSHKLIAHKLINVIK